MSASQVNKNKLVKQSFVLDEVFRCAKNPIYFFKNYCKIQHPTKGLLNFDVYDYQRDAVKVFLNQDRVIINKPRQMGFTTLVSAYIAWFILFHKDKTVLVISKDHESSKGVIRKIKKIFSKLPAWMYLADITANQAFTFSLSNGSSVKSIATTKDAGRSEAVSLLIIDEAAFVRDFEELWGGASFTVSTGGKIFIFSTPKGVDNLFYRLCKEAKEGTNNFYYMVLNWWDNPEYAQGLEDDPKAPGGKTSPWFRSITSGKTEDQVREELLTSFLQTGNNFIDAEKIEGLGNLVEEPKEKRFLQITMDENFWIWKLPVTGNKYLVSVDTCLGSGTDSAAICVLELLNCEIVAEYRGKISPDVLAELALYIGKMYNNAYIVNENNGIGLATSMLLKNSDYNNIVFLESNKTNKLINKWQAIYENLTPGVNISPALRPAVLSKLKEFIENGYLITKSERFKNELTTFTVVNSKPQAAKGFNDDIIMSVAMAVWIRDICPDFGYGKNNSNTSNANLYDLVRINSQKSNYGFHTSLNAHQHQLKIEELKQKMKTAAMDKNTIRHGNFVIDLTKLMK